ncbi:hypothetical protein PASLES2_16305 [Pseudomonas aeruginosa]
MNDVSIIDHFLNVFSTYIDSGFGLLRGEVAFLTATLVAIDMTLAGLYWALGHATGQGEDVMAKLIRKVLYVGAFAYIIGNFNMLASIVFRSFAGLGLTATGSTLSMETFLQPGHLAKTGIDAAAPILDQISEMAGFPEVFINLTPIVVMFLAWLVVILCFFVLAVQLFITLIEFKLTTLAGFVLVPFALWNKTAFLAEKVLGNVVASGIKVLVLAVIVGIGTGLFAEFQVTPDEPSIDHALVVMLASLAMLALGIYGPGIATGLVSGSPQLGAGAMAGVALGAAGTAVAVGAAATGVGGGPLLLPVLAWRRPPPAPSAAAPVPLLRPRPARGRRSKPVPPPPAAARKAQWLAWAMLLRPARKQSARRPPPGCAQLGSAQPPRFAGRRGRRRIRCQRIRSGRERSTSQHCRAVAARLGQAAAPPSTDRPCGDHCRAHIARRGWRWLGARPKPGQFRFLRRTSHAIQATAGALRRYTAACHPVSSRRAGVGRAYRLGPRAGEELAADGLRLPCARAATRGRPNSAFHAIAGDALRGRGGKGSCARCWRGNYAVQTHGRADRVPPRALRHAGSLAVHRPHRGAAELARCL